MPSHLSPRQLRAWANRVQSGACIVRQAQDRTGPEYIRPRTVPSKPAMTPAAFEVHNNVRWVHLIWGSKRHPQGLARRIGNGFQVASPVGRLLPKCAPSAYQPFINPVYMRSSHISHTRSYLLQRTKTVIFSYTKV
jgi:hypothetical protein